MNRASQRRPLARTSPRRLTHLEALEKRTLFSSAPVGVNIDGLADYSTSYMFVDAMKTARGFGSANAPWDAAATVDANGWPTTDAGACIITLPQQGSSGQKLPDISGTYHFSATGFCHVGSVASPLTVSNWHYDANTNTTTADVNVLPGATQVYLSFTDTNGGVQNIKLIRPGYAADTTQVFTNNFLNVIANVQALRFMDFLRTNSNPVVNWSDRSHVTDAIQTTDKGGAWEYVIDLANEAHKDIWINIPAGATQDYVTQLASLLKTNLDPSLHVYVEYSNEVWNGSFGQSGTNYDAAQTEEAANPSVLNYDGCNNSYYYAWRRVAEQIVDISKDFASVYGQSAINTTIRPVLASQIGWGYVLRNQLEFMAANYGSPSNYIYGIAGAPYINIGDLSSSSTLTTDQIFSALQSSISSEVTGIDQYQTLAQNYGVKELFYEGGVELEGNSGGNIASKIDANYDPRMADIVNQYLASAYANNVAMVMYYTLSGPFTSSGTWGLTEDLANLSGPKFTGFNAFATGPQPALTGGLALPSAGATNSIDGGMYVSDVVENAGSGGDAVGLWSGNTYDYLLNAPSGGSYSVSLTAGEWNPSNPVDVYVDGNKAGTITLAQTGSTDIYTTSGALSLGNLAGGIHTLRLQVSGGGYGIHSLNFTNQGVSGPGNLVAAALSASEVKLSWSDVAAEAGFAVERSLDGTNWSQVGMTAAGATSFTDEGLTDSTKYSYRVRALVNGGYSSYSPGASATTLAPAAPQMRLAVSGPIWIGLLLNWTHVQNASSYVIQRLSSSGTWEKVAVAGLKASSYLDTRLTGGARYTYRVVAMDSAGQQLAVSDAMSAMYRGFVRRF